MGRARETIIMTDYRCPSCDQIMYGNREVVSGKPEKTIEACPSCKTTVQLQADYDSDLADVHYFWAEK